MNIVSSEKRTYRLQARADRQQETRRRIVEATAALHTEIGPARTTVAEIARRAGVQRLTVYNHFPDNVQLIMACQEHNFSLRPPPDLTGALAHDVPVERLRAVLTLMYGWYRQTEAIIVPVLQDRGVVPALDQVLKRSVDEPQTQLAAGLASGFSGEGQQAAHVRAVIRLALDFWTWQRLSGEGLDDAEAADVMVTAVGALVGSNVASS
jgi:AcrR family transcriptional regulator